jgi:hypothetical protein
LAPTIAVAGPKFRLSVATIDRRLQETLISYGPRLARHSPAWTFFMR